MQKAKARATAPSCPQKRALSARPLITPKQAAGLEAMFRVLASGTRLRLLHALTRADELCVSDLAEAVSMTPQAVSNQLKRLADRGILASRRDGFYIHYRIVDPCVTSILDLGLCLTEDSERRS